MSICSLCQGEWGFSSTAPQTAICVAPQLLDSAHVLCHNAFCQHIGIPANAMHKLGESIPFALSELDQRVYEPRAVPLGKRCGCVCPGCRQPVVAKHCMAGKRAPHFTHAAGSDCASGYETAVHLAAKQLIEARLVLMFPALSASIAVTDATAHIHRPSKQLAAAGRRELTNVALEEALGQIRPDVRVETIEFGIVLVEVAVTHFVDPKKLALIMELGYGAIEIDLSKVRDANLAALETALFNDPARTKWLYHPDVPAAHKDLLLSIQGDLEVAEGLAARWAAKRAADEQADREKQVEQRRAEIERKRTTENELRRRRHEELKKAVAFKARPEDQKRLILQRRLGLTTLPSILSAKVRGEMAFGVLDPLVWQTTLFGGLIHERASQGQGWLKLDLALKWMRYRFEIAPRLSQSADDAIRDYLLALCEAGAIIECKNDFYALAVADLICFETLSTVRKDASVYIPRLQWVTRERWPSHAQVSTLTNAMVKSSSKAKEWIQITDMLPKLDHRPPLAICSWGSSASAGRDENAVMEFLVRTGFLVLPRPDDAQS
jgi:hypothetical protein